MTTKNGKATPIICLNNGNTYPSKRAAADALYISCDSIKYAFRTTRDGIARTGGYQFVEASDAETTNTTPIRAANRKQRWQQMLTALAQLESQDVYPSQKAVATAMGLNRDFFGTNISAWKAEMKAEIKSAQDAWRLAHAAKPPGPQPKPTEQYERNQAVQRAFSYSGMEWKSNGYQFRLILLNPSERMETSYQPNLRCGVTGQAGDFYFRMWRKGRYRDWAHRCFVSLEGAERLAEQYHKSEVA